MDIMHQNPNLELQTAEFEWITRMCAGQGTMRSEQQNGVQENWLKISLCNRIQ